MLNNMTAVTAASNPDKCTWSQDNRHQLPRSAERLILAIPNTLQPHQTPNLECETHGRMALNSSAMSPKLKTIRTEEAYNYFKP